MNLVKSPHRVIEDFVEAIAQHYVETRQSSHEDPESIAEEFVSEVEFDLKSTLRMRLAELDTKIEVEQTPTAEFSESEIADVAGPSAENVAEPQATMDTPMNLDLGATMDTPVNLDLGVTMDTPVGLADPDASSVDTPTMDSAAAPPSDINSPTMDSAARPANVAPQIHSGSHSNAKSDFSVDAAGAIKVRGSTQASEADAPPDYEILSTLGKGGMGIVYKARHVPLNRLVAVKMILSGADASDEQLRRFQLEAESAANLSHPNIVSVYEVGEYKGKPYFSLEFVEGQSMSDLMKETTLSAKRAAELLIPVARAIDYSHQMGVLHRDLKPQNILLTTDGVPKVADFGLAKRLDAEDEDKTMEGVILGTPGYMAPEQARDTHLVGPQTDIYALGSILYYLMTGRPPFTAPTPFETVRQMLQQDPVSPAKLQTGLDKDLETICMKSLEKDIEKRYQTAGEFADELQRFIDGDPIIARPISRRERVVKWSRRNPRVAALTAIAASLLMFLLVGGIGSAVVINEQKKAEQVARQDAEDNAVRADKNAQVALVNEQQAEENAELANSQATLALDTTRLVLYEAKEFFEGKPELRPLRKNMLGAILGGVERIHADRNSREDVGSIYVASADSQLGQIYLEAGEYEKALDKLTGAETKLHELNADGNLGYADVSQMNITLALGDTYRRLGEPEKAVQQYFDLLKQRQEYFERNPEINDLAEQQSMAEVFGRLGVIYSELGQPELALKFAIQAADARSAAYEGQPNNGLRIQEYVGALTVLSAIYEKAGEIQKMLDATAESLKLQMRLAQYNSDVPTIHNTAVTQKSSARQNLMLGRNKQARELLETATEAIAELLNKTDDQRTLGQAVDSYYLKGVAETRLNVDASESFEKAAEIQRQLVSRSDNVNTQGMLLKILARGGSVDESLAIADNMAESDDNMMNCGYAACGYALTSEHLSDDDPRREEIVSKAIQLTRKLIESGFHDFQSLRSTDMDFAPLQHNAEYLAMLKQEEDKLKKAKVKKTKENPAAKT